MNKRIENNIKQWTKAAALLDAMAQRADVRRTRALKAGNQREADGAARTIEDSKEKARQLRKKVAEIQAEDN